VSSSKTPLRQIISSPRELRDEVERQQDGVLVIKGREGWRMAEVIGADGNFLISEGTASYRGDGMWVEDVGGSVGVHIGGKMPLMVVDEGNSVKSPARTRGQDLLRLVPGTARSGQGKRPGRSGWDIDDLEERLAEEMATTADLPELLGDIAYERWAEFLLATGARGGHQDWSKILHSLEKNVETTRKRLPSTRRVTYTHWTELITRTTLRHILLSKSSTTPSPDYEEPPRKSPNERSLDRVTYLGGLLLPMTVVSSILAIEGPYGPTGPSFWVFWVASGISSLVAVAVIYVDQMRRVDVWVEAVVTGDEGVMGVAEMGMRSGRERMWRKGELGWKGAVKRVSGMERWWPSEGVRFQRPAVMERIVMDV
jgi:hypothetical protein